MSDRYRSQVMLKPPYATRNIAGKGWCGHCQNMGLVIIDGSPSHGSAAPCPMCLKGKMIAQPRVSAANPNPVSYPWTDRMLRERSWSRGLTVHHQRVCVFQSEGAQWPCGVPCSGDWCAYHENPSNRLRASHSGVKRFVRGAAKRLETREEVES